MPSCKDPQQELARKARHAEAMRVYWADPANRARHAEKSRAAAATPEGRERTERWKQQYAANPDWRQNLKAASAKRWADPEQRANASRKTREHYANPEARKAASERAKKRYVERPELREKARQLLIATNHARKGKKFTPEHRAALVEGHLRGAARRGDVSKQAKIEARASLAAKAARLKLIRDRVKK